MRQKLLEYLRSTDWQILVVLFLLAVSIGHFLFYFQSGANLPYADAISRLNIARKVVDNLNPGFAQLGSVWLPLPQVLMIPFIWHDYLWHSGIAGALMSMMAYIIGGIFLYKSAMLLSKSPLASFFALSVYALNVNLAYLQTTAMSEALFLCLMAIVVHYLLLWVHTNQRRYMLWAALAVSGITLIRYEGLALLVSSIGFVGLYSLVHDRKWKRFEGNIILYTVLACFGFGLWTIYLTAIFGDPFFWLRYYGFGPKVVTTATAAATYHNQSMPFLAAVWQYFTSVTWMSGLIPMVFGGVGLLVATIHNIRKQWGTVLVLLLPLSIFLLMALTLQRNTPIVQPTLTIANILSTETSYQTGFNIRYGLMLLPWVALLSVYVFNSKRWRYIPAILLFALFSLQLINQVYPRASLIYEIPARIYGKPDGDMVTWMKEHYDGGYIMMSASGFEDQMFAMELPYRTFIHEGAGKYWSEALDRPARYADWIVVDFNRDSDWLARELIHKQYWSWDYNLAWSGDSVRIYKIKTKPDLEIPNRPTAVVR